MAGRRDPSSAQMKLRPSRQKEQGSPPSIGKAPQGIKKEQLRRSERISRLQTKGEERKLEQRHSSLLAKENDSPPRLPKGRKRSREQEHPVDRIPTERLQTRLQPSLPQLPRRQDIDQDPGSGLSESWRSQISHWARKGQVWPAEFFEEDKTKEDSMHRALARKKLSIHLRRKRSHPSLITKSSATPSDQKPREEKSASYIHARYEFQLKQRGIFMDEYKDNITDESKFLCQRLLETPQTLPEGSLFADDTFKATCQKTRTRNETRVIRDLAQLIVPPAEILAIRGAEHLEILSETVNEGWNNSVAILGPRPQPDYGLGFSQEAFNRDRLEKLRPLIGEVDDHSLFVATYNMYLPFLTAEVKCGAAALDVADRQNAHSMAVALCGLVELFRLVGREKELDREINGFSVSHSDTTVRIFGHYAVINGTETTFYRHPIRHFDFRELDGKEKWTAYTFIKNVYDIWSPWHFKRICSVIDDLPTEQEFEISLALEPNISETAGLSQPLENQDLGQASSSQSVDLQQITRTRHCKRRGLLPKGRRLRSDRRILRTDDMILR